MVQMLTGFQVAQALYVAARLDVATALLDGPRSISELAARVGAEALALGRLLRSLASMGVFAQTQSGEYELTPLAATLAVGTPGSMRDLALTWMETHYLPFGDLLTTVRTGECAATRYHGQPFFEWLSHDPEQVALFTGAMANLTDGIRALSVADYDLPPGDLIADIGGADGSLLAILLARPSAQNRRGIVFDLPHVVTAAKRLLAERALSERVEVVAGDFFEAVPSADVYVVSMILHDWDDERCRQLLRRMSEAARPGARLVALEFVVPSGNQPHLSKVIDLTMLGMLTGRERTEDEFACLFESAGFGLDHVLQSQSPLAVIEATLR
jgi:precorrin-6B methylase 2